MKEKILKAIKTAKKIPQKKHHLDFLAALLTIPVLLSVIILNYNNLNNLQKAKNASPSPTAQEKQIIIVSPSQIPNTVNNPTPISSCKKQIGPISITYPSDNQTVSDNPVCVNISYNDANYCSVVWSYRINGGAWSDYNSNNPCLYNIPNGNVKFELRVQSTVVQSQQQTLTRNFVYNGQGTVPTPTPSSPSSSSSANLNQ